MVSSFGLSKSHEEGTARGNAYEDLRYPMHIFGLKCLPRPKGLLAEERYTASAFFSVIMLPDSKEEKGLTLSIPRGTWNDPALPRIFHPVTLISSPCLSDERRAMREGTLVDMEEITTFWKYGETLTKNVLEAGVWSTTLLSLDRTSKVYSLGPGGTSRVLVFWVAIQSVSIPWSLLSKSIDPCVFDGLTDPENSKGIFVSATDSFSFGPVAMAVSSMKEGGAGAEGF